MTKNSDFKKRVRALAEREGIPYSEARRRINEARDVLELLEPDGVPPEVVDELARPGGSVLPEGYVPGQTVIQIEEIGMLGRARGRSLDFETMVRLELSSHPAVLILGHPDGEARLAVPDLSDPRGFRVVADQEVDWVCSTCGGHGTGDPATHEADHKVTAISSEYEPKAGGRQAAWHLAPWVQERLDQISRQGRAQLLLDDLSGVGERDDQAYLAEARAAYNDAVPRLLAQAQSAKDRPGRSRSRGKKAMTYAELLRQESPFKQIPTMTSKHYEALLAASGDEEAVVIDLGSEDGTEK